MGLPRILSGIRSDARALRLEEHISLFGPLPSPGSGLIDIVDRSRIRGRGGAGFPTAIKLRAVASHPRRSSVIANGAEGEPASAKDRLLLARAPHLVLDGAVLVADAVGADEVIVSVARGNREAETAVERAILERRTRNGKIRFRVVDPPDRYVAGEETALVNWINGGPAKPTFVPPRPFQRGVHGRPTLIQNVETLAHLAMLARFGGEWFRSVGDPEEPGSRLVTVSGAVRMPGVYEIASGTSLSDVLSTAGGDIDATQAILIGGYFGSWLPGGSANDVALTERALRALGASFGAGVIVALPLDVCALHEVSRVVRYLSLETADQCGPCVHGLRAVSDAMTAIAEGHQSQAVAQRTLHWSKQIVGRGACRHPDGATRFVRSALRVFADEVTRHERRGPCSVHPRSAVLPLPAERDREMAWR
jgi:NADH:ubiquinone oxidoreductase subunit F (NADH-binding)